MQALVATCCTSSAGQVNEKGSIQGRRRWSMLSCKCDRNTVAVNVTMTLCSTSAATTQFMPHQRWYGTD
eukprot:352176-Chlamydomonas_euryale.AAC.5